MIKENSMQSRQGANLESSNSAPAAADSRTQAGSGRPKAGPDRLRILWVKVGGLWPVNTGGRLRSFHILSELARRHEVTVMTTHHPAEDGGALKAQLPHCREVRSLAYAAPKQGSTAFVFALMRSWFSSLPVDLYKNRIAPLRRQVEQALASGEYDLCVADFLCALPNVPVGGKVPVVYFSHNVEYMIWKRLGSNEPSRLKRSALALEWRKMRRYETAACEQADYTIAVSEEDREQLSGASPDCRIASVPTGVDVDYFKPGEDDWENPQEIVFTGSMDWHPNEDAILYFIETILPSVRREVPGATLTVVGRNPSDKLKKVAAGAKVTVTGTVDDIRPYVEQAAVYIVPLRIGGGTRLKIPEALAMGKAIVSTTIGAEGLPLEEGRHILRADEPKVFADRVVELLRDREHRKRLGQAGRHLMVEKFSWAQVAGDFEARCREALVRSPGA